MTHPKPSAFQLVAKAATHDIPSSEEPNLPDTEQDLSEHRLQFQIESLRQQLQENRDNHDLRTTYTSKIFWLVCIWLACVIIGLLMAGYKNHTGFILSDKVLIAFIITTTFNVLGLFVIVAKWMFQSNGKK